MAQADRTRQKAFGRLDTYLDENGGINDPAKAGGVHAQRPGVHHHSCNACMDLACMENVCCLLGTPTPSWSASLVQGVSMHML